MFFVYRYFDKVTKTFAPLSFVEVEPKTLYKRLHSTILTNPQQLIQAEVHRCEVTCVGIYNQETGTIEDLPEYFADQVSFDISTDFAQVDELRKQVSENGQA